MCIRDSFRPYPYRGIAVEVAKSALKCIDPRECSREQVVALEAEGEVASCNAISRLACERRVGVGGKAAVRVEEKEEIAAGSRCRGVELMGPTASSHNHLRGEPMRAGVPSLEPPSATMTSKRPVSAAR